MADAFRCGRCAREDVERVDRPPFPNELGTRIQAEICQPCWEEWKQRQMLLINHYGLKLNQAEAREFLYANLRAFLFGEGEGSAEIDPAQEGSVEW